MADLTQYIDKELMIAAAKEMRDQADAIEGAREDVYGCPTPPYVFGGPGGTVDYPTSYETMGVQSSSILPWDRHTFMEGGVVFRGDTDAPWWDELYRKWHDSVLNRTAEAYDVERELTTLKRCIMQYLEDTGQVDLENAGLLENIMDEEPAPHGPGWVEAV